MGQRKTKNGKPRPGKRKTVISVSTQPKNMSPEQWQIALRKQVAERENFGIEPPYEQGDAFVVSSSKSNRVYTVHYYGPEATRNRCECMDFKTSGLGTCKHIEAITLCKNGKYARKHYLPQSFTSVYVDYVDGRKIKVHRGTNVTKEMERLINSCFDENNVIKDAATDPSLFIRQAKALDESFVWEADAMAMLIDERDRQLRNRIISEKYKASMFDGLLKTALHPYQAEGVRFAFRGGRTINADEMGLGKTVQALATAELLKREGLVNSVIIICPTSLKYQWLSEIEKFTNSSALVVEGIVTKRREMLSDPNYFYKICSFHAMSNSIKAGFIPDTDMIVYDELQRLKNKDTQMGKQLRLLQSRYVMALSGTPLENKLDELYSVTQLVDQYLFGPYYKFTADTTLTDDTGKVLGYKNLNAIAQKLKDTLIRRKKSDVKLQMPTRTDTNLFVPMTKEQRAIHDEYKFQVSVLVNKWHRFKFLSEADRKRLMLFLSMMRMVCDSTYILDQQSRHDTKIDEAMAIITNMLENEEGKVVIFSQWERMLRILATELREKGIDFCYLSGSVPSAKRKGLIDRFRDDKDCRIFLSTDAGATGLNLQTASLLINLDLPWNPAVLEQRIARIYRLGQENPVQIINMVSRDTIEERMLATLKFKSDVSAGILDGGDDAVFFDRNKFERIVEVVDNVVMEQPERIASEIPQTPQSTLAPEVTETPDSLPVDNKPTCTDIDKTPGREHHSNNGNPSADQMRATVADGLQAIGKIADMLRTPESTQALVDALVTEDPQTGKTTLSLPVPDKKTVVNLLSAFAAFLNR